MSARRLGELFGTAVVIASIVVVIAVAILLVAAFVYLQWVAP